LLKCVDFTWVGWYNRQEMKLCKIEANGMKSVDFHKAGRYLWAFVRWVLTGIVIGCVCGVVGGLFAMAVEKVTHLRMHNSWLMYLLPLGGLMIAGVYRLLRLPLSVGTDEIISTVRTQKKVPVAMAPAIFFSTVVTHLLGGSAGREGAALQLGGSLGAAIGDHLHPHKDSRRLCELCGMAALFSALFGTPLTATVFVLEIIEIGRINERGLLPCLSASLTAALVARAIGAPAEVFPLAGGLSGVNTVPLLQAAGLGIACALTSMMFCRVMHASGRLFRKMLPNPWVRVAVGGVAVVQLSLLLGTTDYQGGGMQVITAALAGQALPAAFLLKLVFTAITLGTGFKGGEIVPSFFVGATMGCVAAPLLGMSPALGAGLGLVGVFCGVTNAPLASILLSLELFGMEYLPLFAVTAVVSFMMSGHDSLYRTQKFAQPKLGHERNQEEYDATDTSTRD